MEAHKRDPNERRILIENRCENGRPWSAKTPILDYTSCKYDLWAVPKIDRKSMPKWVEKGSKINSKNARRPDFLKFWCVSEGGDFLMIVGTAQNHPTSGKIRYFWPRWAPRLLKWVGPAECAGPPKR